MDNKGKYKALCDHQESIPIFSQYWWLDCVCGKDNWDVAIVENGHEVVASLPYYIKKKIGFSIISMPLLTQKLGVWIKYPYSQKYEVKLSYEKKIINQLIEQLPSVDQISFNCDYRLTNWLPFYWKGYIQTTRYTYIIEDLNNKTEIKSTFKSNIRREINKAEKIVQVKVINDIEKFYSINKLTFQRQGVAIPYSFDFLKELNDVCQKKETSQNLFSDR